MKREGRQVFSFFFWNLNMKKLKNVKNLKG